jgi:hypothetical protein
VSRCIMNVIEGIAGVVCQALRQTPVHHRAGVEE